jgi:hypothetical protein
MSLLLATSGRAGMATGRYFWRNLTATPAASYHSCNRALKHWQAIGSSVSTLILQTLPLSPPVFSASSPEKDVIPNCSSLPTTTQRARDT